MTIDDLLAACREARPEMEWRPVPAFFSNVPTHVVGERDGHRVFVCPEGANKVWARLGEDGAVAFSAVEGGDVIEAVDTMLRTLHRGVEHDAREHEKAAAALRKEAAAIAPPMPLDRCASCAWPLKASRDDGCVRGDCAYRGNGRGPANPLEPRRYAREVAEWAGTTTP